MICRKCAFSASSARKRAARAAASAAPRRDGAIAPHRSARGALLVLVSYAIGSPRETILDGAGHAPADAPITALLDRGILGRQSARFAPGARVRRFAEARDAFSTPLAQNVAPPLHRVDQLALVPDLFGNE